jgi:hypothetical protein
MNTEQGMVQQASTPGCDPGDLGFESPSPDQPPETWYTALMAVETPRGKRWQGVSYAGSRGPLRYANSDSDRLPRGAEVRYRSPLRLHRNDAYEQARGRTIHHNLYHGEYWAQAAAFHHGGTRCLG